MKTILGKRLLILTAHPDDESYLAAGTMYANHKAGGQTYVWCATLGEKGKSMLKVTVTTADLKKIRKQELSAVSKFLKVDKTVIGNFPDGGLRGQAAAVYAKALPFAKRHKPEIIMSFGEDGITGHYDHVAVGKAAAKLAKRLGLKFYKFCATPSFSKQMNIVRRRRRFGVYKNKVMHNRPTFKIKIDPKVKLKALRFHKSQCENNDPFHNIPAKAVTEMLRYDYFCE